MTANSFHEWVIVLVKGHGLLLIGYLKEISPTIGMIGEINVAKYIHGANIHWVWGKLKGNI